MLRSIFFQEPELLAPANIVKLCETIVHSDAAVLAVNPVRSFTSDIRSHFHNSTQSC